MSLFQIRIADLRGPIAVLLAMLFLAAEAQEKPSPSVAEAQRQLLQLTVSDDMNTNVPPNVRAGIVKLKQALVAQTDAIVTTLPSKATAALVKQRLDRAMPPPAVGKLSDNQWVKRANDNSDQPVAGLYGGEFTVSVTMPKPSLLLVQEGFGIACGDDNILLGYSNAGGAWTRILLWQSKQYANVGEAFGDGFQTLLLRPKYHDNPLLLVLTGTPWCTSTVSGFSMDVFDLGASLDNTPFWHGEHGYRRADLDPPLTLRATEDGFEVRTSVNVWADGDRVSRKGVMRYAVNPDGVHRVEPLAMNAGESVEEWLGMTQTEAAEFADEPAGSRTWKMFQTFTFRGKPEDADKPFSKVGAVRACKDDPAHFQVHVTSTAFAVGVPGGRPGPAYFVQVRQVPNGYRIHAVTLKKDAACDDPDLMAP